MFEKTEILIIIFALLLAFYLVILWGASGKPKTSQSPEITSGKIKTSKSPEIKGYLFGVRVLIIFIGIVSFILWTFL